MAARLRRLLSAYWFRCALVTASAGLLVATLLSAIGAAPFWAVLPRAFVHSAVMGSLVGSILPRVAHRLIETGAVRAWSAILVTLVGLALVGTGIACALLVLGGAHPAGVTFRSCVGSSLQVNLILSLALGVGMTFYELQRNRLDALTLALRTRELEHERERKSALEARLSSLESRLHPHFLFNTLNAITELIHENPDRAERTVERLAALLRASLDATERGLVPLSRELELVRDYLEIEKARLGDRLAYTVDVPTAVAASAVPPLAVQTLVENSIKHAIAPRPHGGRIRVDAAAVDGRLLINVWDDGPGFTAEAIRPGHGLDNVQGRLAARFGDAGSLSIARHEGGTRVTLAMPRSGAAGA
jgi:two-component system sensor histidine kinase AlgZ